MSMLARFATTGGGVATYIEDVFSTYLYTGTGSTQTITNGIDLAGKGGLVWIKQRSVVNNHFLAHAATVRLRSDATNANVTTSDGVTSFNSNGFSIGANANLNGATDGSIVSWTFRKQAKFFDVVTYTGDGAATRAIAHSLGSTPGFIVVKKTSSTGVWLAWHRSFPQDGTYIRLDSTGATGSSSPAIFTTTAPTTTNFSISYDAGRNSDFDPNINGATYVAYLFAHDAGGFGQSGSDNVVSCGSYTGNGSTTGPTVTLGYEPQWLLIKRTDTSGLGWYMQDVMRGFSQTQTTFLEANSSAAEVTINVVTPTATGFQLVNTQTGYNANGGTYIYIAIRRGPMKTPTTGTSVFQPVVYTGTNVDNRLVDMSLLTDMVFVRQRDDTVLGGMVVGDRLRGDPYLLTGTTAAEVSDADSFMTPTSGVGNSWSAMNGFGVGNDATSKLNASTTSNNQIAEGFRRAPGFFDVVCYTGVGAGTSFTHNLGVTPELIIIKLRSSPASNTAGWFTYHSALGTGFNLLLNTNAGSASTTAWNTISSTTVSFTGGVGPVSSNGDSYVAYLFATCPGVSKVGSYTGTGNVLQIDCGFTGGARFVLIKRTDSTGDWYVWDSARGIVAGNDPYLLLNSTAAEVTTTDWVDTYSAGFELSNAGGNNANINTATYVFLAVA